MTPLTRRHMLGGMCACSALALAACQTTSPTGRVDVGYRPNLASDEGALWHIMDREEANVRDSRFLVRDAELNAYVRDIACKLASNHCGDVRTYVMRTPFFNASMAPNGMMRVWTGLLLRAQNEAQLAAVIGHEIGHYLERHSLQIVREARARGDLAAVLGIGMGAIAIVPQMMLMASLYSFSRDQERQADDIGAELMVEAGYEPMEASKVWSQLIEERNANPDRRSDPIIFATHPAAEERVESLKTKAASLDRAGLDRHEVRYRQALRPLRRTLFEDELRLRQYARSLKLFEIIGKEQGEDAALAYYTGEVHRLRNDAGDRDAALAAYQRALVLPEHLPETHRSIGLVHLQTGDRSSAGAAFREYLRLVPAASDREMIESYLVS